MKVNLHSRKVRGITRTFILALLGGVGILWLVVLLAVFLIPATPNQTPTEIVEVEQGVLTPSPSARQGTTTHGPVVQSFDHNKSSSIAITPLSTPASGAGPQSPDEIQKLLQALIDPSLIKTGLTPENAAVWAESLRALVQGGTLAIPAIRDYLEKNVDMDFGSTGKKLIGYSSVRLALIDALSAIGSAEAVTTLSSVLQVTADPREVALITQNLEKIDPGQHQIAGLQAARQTLGLAANGELAGRDMAPIFEMLQRYGDSSIIPELQESAQHWGVYAALALAQLPEGAGLPALVEMSSDRTPQNSQARVSALKMLAQMAPEFEQARSALVEQLRSKQLSAYDFLSIAPVLAGDQIRFLNSVLGPSFEGLPPHSLRTTYIPSSNQSFVNAPLGATTPEQINQRRALIQELMGLTSDPAVRAALERANTLLAKRTPQVAGVK